MKKGFALFLSCVMSTALIAGCGGGNTGSEDTTGSSAASESTASGNEAGSGTDTADTEAAGSEAGGTVSDGTVYNIAVLQQLEHDALDEATRGFEEACKELFGEGNVNIEVQNAQGEQANCSTIANNFVASNVDLILANGTTALQSCAAATNQIPILGTSITDFGAALDIADWTGASGTNISGTSDLAPIDEQEAMLKELVPDVTKVGIVYCSAEANSAYQAEEFAKALEADGIDYAEYTAADSNEIQSVVTAAIAECDALYIPTDNTMASNTEIINNICEPAGIPIIAGEENLCRGCGIATLSIDYYDIGYKAGEMAYDILVNGADITTMNVEYAPVVEKKYNAQLCEALGITVPDDYVVIE